MVRFYVVGWFTLRYHDKFRCLDDRIEVIAVSSPKISQYVNIYVSTPNPQRLWGHLLFLPPSMDCMVGRPLSMEGGSQSSPLTPVSGRPVPQRWDCRIFASQRVSTILAYPSTRHLICGLGTSHAVWTPQGLPFEKRVKAASAGQHIRDLARWFFQNLLHSLGMQAQGSNAFRTSAFSGLVTGLYMPTPSSRKM